jgi:hypothetical protein
MGVSRGVSTDVSLERLVSAGSGPCLVKDKEGPLGVMTGGRPLEISIRGVRGVFGTLERNSSTEICVLAFDLGVKGMPLLIGSLGGAGMTVFSGGLLEMVMELPASDLGVRGTGVCPRIVVITRVFVFFSSFPRGVSMPRLAENLIGGASLTSRGRENRDAVNALYTEAIELDLRHI